MTAPTVARSPEQEQSADRRMPFETIQDALPVLEEYARHWEAIDQRLGARTALELPGGILLGDFRREIDELESAVWWTRTLESELASTRGQRDRLKKRLRNRMKHFRAALHALFPDDPAWRPPRLPPLKAPEARFFEPVLAASRLWEKLDGTETPTHAPPLLLEGVTERSDFTADIAALRAAYRSVDRARTDLNLAREERNRLLEQMRERVYQYRLLVSRAFDRDDAVIRAMPRRMRPPQGKKRRRELQLEFTFESALTDRDPPPTSLR